MSVNVVNHSLIHKSVHRFRNDDAYKDSIGFSMQAEERIGTGKRVPCASGATLSQRSSAHTNIAENNSVNKSIKTTAVNNSGRLSFKGAAEAGSGLINKMLKNPWTKWFINMAGEKQILFDAVFNLGITCGIRPLAIMCMPADDKKKNRMAAAHSIASGVIALGLAILVTTPLRGALGKLAKNPSKYMNKETVEYFFGNKRMVETVYTKGLVETLVMIPRAILTIALIPQIDKHLLNNLFLPPKSDTKYYEAAKAEANGQVYKPSTFTQPASQATHVYDTKTMQILFRGNSSPMVSFKEFREGRANLS